MTQSGRITANLKTNPIGLNVFIGVLALSTVWSLVGGVRVGKWTLRGKAMVRGNQIEL